MIRQFRDVESAMKRRVPLDPDALRLLRMLQMKAGGSVYVFLSLGRLRALAAKRDLSQQPPANALVNNLLRTFDRIQENTRALLAERRGVELDKVEWRIGCLHDLRRSFGTHMANAVPMLAKTILSVHRDTGDATRVQRQFNELRDLMMQFTRMGAMKRLISVIGGLPLTHTRPPNRDLDAGETAALEEAIGRYLVGATA